MGEAMKRNGEKNGRTREAGEGGEKKMKEEMGGGGGWKRK